MRKILMVLLSMALVVTASLGLTACGEESPSGSTSGESINSSDTATDDKTQIEVTVPEEVTLPMGTNYVPEITVSPEDAVISVKVTDPDGADVVLGENYSFNLEKFGEYTLNVLIEGEIVATSRINAVDGTAPEITTKISDKNNVELGVYDKFLEDLKEIKANDDIDGENVTAAVESIRFAEEAPVEIVDNKVVLNKVGAYKVYYYVMDNSGNRTEEGLSYVINTVDTIKPELICENIYYAWLDANGNVAIPEVAYKDNGQVVIEAVVKNSEGAQVEVKDGKFQAVIGKYTIDFTANDGYNKSEVVTSTLRVMESGFVFDFADEADGSLFEGGVLEAGEVKLTGAEAGEVKGRMTVGNWADYGYLTVAVKNNGEAVDMTVALSDGANTYDVGVINLSAGYNGTKNIYFRESELLASSVKDITLKFSGAYDVTLVKAQLKSLNNEIFKLASYEATIKTFDKFVAPEIEYLGDNHMFVKDETIEVIGDVQPVVENGKYIFENQGVYSIVYKVTTKTSQVYEKTFKVIVEKGDPVLVIKDLPLGVIGKTAYISRFAIHNVDEQDIVSVKATYKAPGSEEVVAIEGGIDGFSFVAEKVGNYEITITAETKNGTLTATGKMYAKPLTEIASYENNNGVVEGYTSKNDWLGGGKMSFNANPDYVYSGNQSVKYEIPAGKNCGTTYFLENMLKTNDPSADVIQFALKAEEDGVITIYGHFDAVDGLKYYGYSEYIYLKANEWRIFTAPLAHFVYNGVAVEMPSGKLAGLTGLEFGNKGGSAINLYVDQISLFNHKDLVDLTVGKDIAAETYTTIDVPQANKLYPADSYSNLVEKLYNAETLEEVDIKDKKQFSFTVPGNYVYEVTYTTFGEEHKVTQNYTVTETTEASLMVEEFKLDMMAGEGYILPAYSTFVPSTIQDAVMTITAQVGEETIVIDNETREFAPQTAGMYVITYKLAYSETKEKVVTYETYVRSRDDLYTFENTPDGIIKGIDEGDGNIGVSINTDMNYVVNGKQSLKLTYKVADYGTTTAFGSANAYWKNQGFMKNNYDPIGYTEGKSTGANAVIFKLYAEKAGQVILDIPGSAKEWDYSYSKVYDIQPGWNELRYDNGCKLNGAGSDVDYSQGIYKFFIGSYFADGAPTEDTVFYVDDVKLIFDESSYELEPGDFLTFEKVDGAYQGVENISAGDAGVQFEVSSDWASQGNNSLKVTFDNSNLQETTLAGSTGRHVLFNSKWGGHIGIADAHKGANALQLTVNPQSDMDILFDIEYHEGGSNTWAYTMVYHLKANVVKTLTISPFDVIQGGPILYDDGLFMCNINYLDFGIENKTEKEVLYVDGFKFVTVPEYSRPAGEIASFERGSQGYTGFNQFKSVTAATHDLSDEWASSGVNSVKVTFDKANFAKEANLLGHTWNRGVIAIGDYGHPAFPEGAFNEVKYGTNAIAITINASEAFKAIFEIYYPNASNGWGAYSRIYEIKKGVNEIVIGLDDAAAGTLDFSNGITQFNMNYVVEPTETTGKTVVYFDNFRYYRIADIIARDNLCNFESVSGDYDGHKYLTKGETPKNATYSVTDEWASEGTASLKVTIDRANIPAGDTTTIGGGGLWSIVNFGGWGSDSLPARDQTEMNAFHMVIKAKYRQSIVFTLYDRSDAWMYVNVVIQPGVNDIIITADDKADGNVGTFDFTKGMSRMFVNFVTNEGDVMDVQTLLIDNMEYINIR